MSENSSSTKWIDIGLKKKLIKINNSKIEYIFLGKKYTFTDPEEPVRASFYVELIEKYSYPINRIDLEVSVPRRTPSDFADLVIFSDDDKKSPYIVAEFKKDGISMSEIEQSVEQVFGNANSLRSKYAIQISGDIRTSFDVKNYPPQEREKNIISDIPKSYGKVNKYRFKKSDLENDLRTLTKDELLKKFQQCHDILWEGGKRNPAEAFDEMSKLMFCKISDEKYLTDIGNYYKFQIGTHETSLEIGERIHKIYSESHTKDPLVFKEPLKISNETIYRIIEILQGISLNKTDLDAKGVAFEHFLGSVFRGEMGQYFTPRQIVEFMIDVLEPTEKDIVIDPACGSGGFLIYTMEKVKQDLFKKLEHKDAQDRWVDFSKYQLYGIEINSQLSRVSMMNMILHEDGHTNIENNDALEDFSKFDKRRDIQKEKYTLLLTNPPFGSTIKSKDKSYLKDFIFGTKLVGRKSQKTEILFIERCVNLLKKNGRMGIILPDGILMNSSLKYIRTKLLEWVKILAIISLPAGAFSHYGTGVKASILFLEKTETSDKDEIFMSTAEHIGYDTTGRPDKNDLPTILTKWREFEKNVE